MKKLGLERLNDVLGDLQLKAGRAGLEHSGLAAESVVSIGLKKVDCTSLFSATLGQIKSDSQRSAFAVRRHQFIISFPP